MAGIAEDNYVALLTEGTPQTYRLQLASTTPANTDRWLAIALAIEDTKKRFPVRNIRTENGALTAHEVETKPKRGKPNFQHVRNAEPDMPSTPCCYCLNKGWQEYHWHRARPIRNQATLAENGSSALTQTQSTPQSNAVTSEPFVWFDLVIDSQNVRAFLDSGSTINVMSSAAAKRLKQTETEHVNRCSWC
jgi:hypothetical protein